MHSRSIGLALACAFILGIGLRPLTAFAFPQNQPPSAAPAPAPQPDLAELHFSGEVTRGMAFTRDIGHNLTFRLTPATADEGGGWVIEILPPVEPSDDPVEFAAIATPPYHAYNDRYVAAAFGYSAREAMQAPIRKFNFVQSVLDEQRANEVVNAGLYPSIVSDSDKARIAAEAAALELGTGQLQILHSRITTGKDGAPDTIAWFKFEVVLNFSPGLTLQQVLAPHPPATKH
jgi:hypothetical protein